MRDKNQLRRRTVLKSVGTAAVGVSLVGATAGSAVGSNDGESVTFTANLDEYEFVTEASLTITERDGRWVTRESMSVETPKETPVQRYNVGLESDLLEELEGDAHDDEVPSVAELKHEASAVVEVATLEMSPTEFVTQRPGSPVDAADAGTMDDTWNGLLMPTASRFCGDLATTELNINWEHHGTNPETMYSEYHDHIFNSWSVDGAECNFPDYDVFATTWHVDSESDSAGQTGSGEVESSCEANYYNTDFPMPYAGTHYADHTASVDISYTGSVTRDWDRSHSGNYSWALDKPSVTTW
ncbi:uncharacterized protein Nmag_2225 [Natrialba magadii ATCC 43099]|uniref:Uncharacterized protein n=1 Tax=Natrialba magadii (strain ATCC 43099 / DSM 3394 / CCM 3739 / CIP 104546 / IAM 13178 / JCM 8861 / NBRC 102185 / NCIMB 2190 / MS3) TaxID=547559 RepID=D3SWQ8_NATMM|nr:hypothetical protein [Natrialba magadii]ADD05790.1 uncharacterized protein Nmag_2225 [Natrialba magadii ATCC 43099]ELY30134.1 hypothetical protein C500_09279 [Natrialba magadii ATCC 43099]